MSHPVATQLFLLHILGIILVYSAYGALIARGMLGSESRPLRKFGAMTSGIGLLLILVSGFGMIAKLSYADYTSLWVLIKMGLFVLLGGMTALINRKPSLSQIWFWVIILLGLASIATVYYKPGS